MSTYVMDDTGVSLSALRREAWDAVQTSGALPDDWRAHLDAFVRSMEPDAINAAATAWLARELADRDRSRVLNVEREHVATRGTQDAAPSVEEPRWETPPAPTPRVDTVRVAVDAMIRATESQINAEWTPRVLGQSISLPDGTKTTWGAASVEQHQARQRMFAEYAGANIEGAARHARAIRDIERSGVTCLNDLSGGQK